MPGNCIPSMYLDTLKSKITEIEYLNGEIYLKGVAYGIDVSFNKMVLDKINGHSPTFF